MENRRKRLLKAVSLSQAYLQPSEAAHNELPFASPVLPYILLYVGYYDPPIPKKGGCICRGVIT